MRLTDAIETLKGFNLQLGNANILKEPLNTVLEQLEPLQGKAVLILGDMPEGCEDCLLSKWSEWRYEYFCFYTNEKCEGAGVAACPLRIVGGGTDEI